MNIDRQVLVSAHDPEISSINFSAPLTVGNGSFAFSVDPTGLQTLYKEYSENSVPLCTMSQWGWHTMPDKEGRFYTSRDVEMTGYRWNGRTVHYPVEKKAGNESVYDWLRQNPHRMDLAAVGLKLDGHDITAGDISGISQRLWLYQGYIDSSFLLAGSPCRVRTAVDSDTDSILLAIDSPLAKARRLSLSVDFPYGSPDTSGADWRIGCTHSIQERYREQNLILLQHTLDNTVCFFSASSDKAAVYTVRGCSLSIVPESEQIYLKMTFAQTEQQAVPEAENPCPEMFDHVSLWWKDFWKKGGIISFSGSSAPEAPELERRIILSQYLQAVHCSGNIPPAETGLFCNSWYGKFHLEMHFWHSASLAFWNRSRLLERSFPWYLKHLPEACRNAAENGYKGARWPKMVAPDAVNSPSNIAVLLVWQQPHILYMLEAAYRSGHTADFLHTYWDVVRETADFMADFAVYNTVKQCYELLSPLIPVQESYDPHTVLNPSFEVSYWKLGLQIAVLWAQRLGKKVPPLWQKVSDNMAPLPSDSYFYLAHENCPETFGSYAVDHPSMLSGFSYFADPRVDPGKMKRTLEKVLDCWDFTTLWGWDFAAMAMTAVRLGMPDTAVKLLLCNSPKNTYEVNGNNYQRTRTDLPAYYPGNGSLLLAVAMMAAGYAGCTAQLPGFPKNGTWKVTFENISPLFT
jgi:protein-glucosylgalactosylhydroxylysine glucosidase